jgi:hypothetical protein
VFDEGKNIMHDGRMMLQSFYILIVLTSTLLGSCGKESSSSDKKSSDQEGYSAGSCTLKEPDGKTDMCYMVRALSAGYDFDETCTNISKGTPSDKACDPTLYATTCETNFSGEKDSGDAADLTYKYFYKSTSTMKCLGTMAKISKSQGKSKTGNNTGDGSVASGELVGGCHNPSTKYCKDRYGPTYNAKTEKDRCARSGQLWKETGCSKDNTPGQCQTVSLATGQLDTVAFYYNWNADDAQSFCAPRKLSAHEVKWVPN